MKTALLVFALAVSALAQTSPLASEVDGVFPAARSLYLDLHQNPELSSHELRTASELANKLRGLGYEVTEHVGGTGIVALLKNGKGPTVMLRTELDALPVEEKTGLPYASHARAKDDQGHDVAVMQACGHDMHMASLYGAAEIMEKSRQQWHGTLMLIGQPAEETLAGAKAMLADGLFTRFPKPNFGLALHTSNELPAGKIGLSAGYRKANADALRVTVYGRGGHGSKPESTIDPVLITAKIVVALQAIVSREIRPGEPAVISVGLMQAGTKNNIIPDEGVLGLSVRSYSPEVRQKLLASIQRVVEAEAKAGGAVRVPMIEHSESTDAVYNDPDLTQRLRPALALALGDANVVEVPPVMASEDYSAFIQQGVPSVYLSLGGADPQAWSTAKGADMPSNHSSLFYPDLEPTLRTGMTTEVAALKTLLQ